MNKIVWTARFFAVILLVVFTLMMWNLLQTLRRMPVKGQPAAPNTSSPSSHS
jgi:hypothetical protein